MEIGPILRAMTRNKLGVVLIALQIAFTMTVMVNAIFIINERSQLMARPSGLDEPNTFYLTSTGFGEQFNDEVTTAEDLDMLRNTPGVNSVTFTNAIPISGSGSSNVVRKTSDLTLPGESAAEYRVDEQAIDAMALEIIAGKNFSPSDVVVRELGADLSDPQVIIITEALAEALFPEEALNAIGRTIYVPGDSPKQVIGVVDRLQAPWPSYSNIEYSYLMPLNQIDSSTTYLIRAEPGQRDRLMLEVEELLANSNPSRIIRKLNSIEEARTASYLVDNAMSKILYVIVITLVFITSMGIVGLAVFGINRRRKQIGTRRALGATQPQVLRYFMTENFLITGVGVTLGAILTIGFNVFLVAGFNMPPMAWYYTPLGMLVLILVGQLAVLGPSRGAARIAPAIATRSI
jgi:putative ABC transport system permease protein